MTRRTRNALLGVAATGGMVERAARLLLEGPPPKPDEIKIFVAEIQREHEDALQELLRAVDQEKLVL